MNPPAAKDNTFSKYRDLAGQFSNKLIHCLENHAAIVVSAISVVLACILLWLIMGQHNQQRLLLIDAYGASLSKLTSSQLKFPMSANNLVGLQSVLNDLIKQDRVINAVIYNVDNKISVQAGEINDTAINSTKAYTSPINLDEALLGSLTIHIDNSVSSNYWLIVVLLLVVAVMPLIFLREKAFYTKPKIASEIAKVKPEAGFQAEQAEAAKQNHQALLLIEFDNLDRLYKQLNADARNKALEKLRLTSKKILTLYSGKNISSSTQTLVINFESKDKKDCLSNAVCAAYLLTKAREKQQWLINFSIFIYDKDGEISADTFSQLNANTNAKEGNKILIKKELMIKNGLEDLAPKTSTEDDYINIISLSEKHEKLIENQLLHIL